MNSTTPKKNGKKSPVGQRVAALFSDGYYAPAVIQALKEPDSENRTFTVKFDDGEQSDCLSVDMIGSNFAKLSDVKLKQFQKVYTTYNGREISGYIQTCKGDKVILSVPSDKEEKLILERSLEEIRLLDRRRSQRLQNSQMDYRKMIEEGSPRKNRPVSASIEVPKANRIRKTSEEPTMTELMAAMVLSNLSCSPVFHNPPAQTVKDASPQSFGSSGVGSWSTDPQHLSPSRQPPANSSSGSGRGPSSVQVKTELCDEGAMIPRQPSSPEDPIESDAGTILMERTTPTRAGHAPLENEDISDEPQDLSVPRLHVERNAIKEEESSSPRADTPMEESSQRPKNTMPIPMTLPAAAAAIQHGIPFQYYFPSALIQQHYGASLPVQITSVPRSQPEVRSSGGGNGNSAPGYIDSKMHRHLHRAAPYHKEESSVPSPAADNNPTTMHYGSSAPTTYYPFPGSPIPVSSLSFSPTHRVRQQQQARSPLTATPPAPPMSSSQQQHAKAAQSAPVVVPAFAILRDHPYQSQIAAQPINIPGSKAFSWHSAGVNYSPKSPVIHHHSQMRQGSPKLPFPMSPKSVPLGRKVRGDGKKCRKVYGMENRDLWCTACRWKKACQRFPD